MPLPPPVIQFNPPGLLSLLGLKNGGVNPPSFGGIVAPGFELSDWYLRAKQELINNASITPPNGAITGYGGTVATVPQGEWWYVRHYNAMISTVAGDSVGRYALAYGSGGVPYQVSDTNPAIAASASDFAWAPMPFWVPPGGTLGFVFGTNVILGASVAQSRICISRCQV
ncbi:MAG TPA: hypothetical protein VF077_04945 [Nitrospiraceae bacterium]